MLAHLNRGACCGNICRHVSGSHFLGHAFGLNILILTFFRQDTLCNSFIAIQWIWYYLTDCKDCKKVKTWLIDLILDKNSEFKGYIFDIFVHDASLIHFYCALFQCPFQHVMVPAKDRNQKHYNGAFYEWKAENYKFKLWYN